MPIAFDEIEKEFANAVKSHPAFVGWKKKGKRMFWSPVGELQHGVELSRFKGSFENTQWIGVCSFVSYPAEKPSGYVPSDTWRDGRMFLRAYIVPGREMVAEPTFRSGAVVKLCDIDDLNTWAAALPTDFGTLVVPWLQQRTTINVQS